MDLKLTDEQTEALTRELSQIVQNDRYPLSSRIRVLKEILVEVVGAEVGRRPRGGAAHLGRQQRWLDDTGDADRYLVL
jgi:hypothetical protein